jgi:molybdenum cofactor cytidylyltransferase
VSVAGVILAAGESRRMGSPKALLRYREESFLDTLIGLFEARCAPVIVVLGAHAEAIRAAALRPATFVVNPDYRRGQTSSMQSGLRAVLSHADVEGVLFTLVDHPAVAPATLDALLAAVPPGRPRPLVRVPRYGDQRGHPVWFARDLIAEFLALPETGAAREIVRGHAAETEFVDVNDPGILADIDDPAAYASLTGALR